MPIKRYRAINPTELVLGLVYGAGTETAPLHNCLRQTLESYDYGLRTVRLSQYFPTMLGRDFNDEAPDATSHLQDMGDELRDALGEGNHAAPDALARLAIYLIADTRRRTDDSSRTAWLIRSLRRPEEVAELRRVYGTRFILIGAHVPESVRQMNAINRRRHWSPTTSALFDVDAISVIRRDEDDRHLGHGQAMRDTFSKSDFFVDARSSQALDQTVPRIVRIMFGATFEPPTRLEHAMNLAHSAGLRSSEMGRQVGAALMSARGDILAVGTNDVPTPDGGLYWSPDQPDGRDFAQSPPQDSNTEWQRRVARELLVRMAETKWLRQTTIETINNSTVVTDSRLDDFLADATGTRFSSLTEFGRAVHAEMDVLLTAARHGYSTAGATLVCTTFPCHNCIRHIIAAGVKRVVFLHPYAKSLGRELHADAIVLDPEDPHTTAGRVPFQQLIGVAPRCYPQYFDFSGIDRKDPRGAALTFAADRKEVVPRVIREHDTFGFGGSVLPAAYVARLEQDTFRAFVDAIKARPHLHLPRVTTANDEP